MEKFIMMSRRKGWIDFFVGYLFRILMFENQYFPK